MYILLAFMFSLARLSCPPLSVCTLCWSRDIKSVKEVALHSAQLPQAAPVHCCAALFAGIWLVTLFCLCFVPSSGWKVFLVKKK